MSAMPERVKRYCLVPATGWANAFLAPTSGGEWALYDEVEKRALEMESGYRATIAGLESALLAAEARVRELQAPVMCSVCVGRPLPSGRPCICGDTIRTEAAEMHGLRVRCFELEDENATLRAERDALVPLARVGLFLRDKLLTQVTDPEMREHLVWCMEEWVVAIDGEDTPRTTQARAILAREAGE